MRINRHVYHSIRPWLFKLDPERVHNATRLIAGLAQHVLRRPLRLIYQFEDESLGQGVWGVTFPNPVGLAAGFDKNAQLLPLWGLLGFGHVEVGSVTAQPSRGNPRPRLFRVLEDRAMINRLGLPNQGVARVARRLRRVRTRAPVVCGISIATTYSPGNTGRAAVDDCCTCYSQLAKLADYVTLNISCPNTADGRTFEEAQALDTLLTAIGHERLRMERDVPLLIKLSPLDTAKVAYDSQLEKILELAVVHKVSGVVVSNTAVDREGLKTPMPRVAAMGPGGLSGEPLFARSLRMVEYVYSRTDGQLPIIAVGGISTAEAAYAMIRTGASLVQIYTGLVYKGPKVVYDLKRGLAALLQRDGFTSIRDAVGSKFRERAQKAPNDAAPREAFEAVKA